MTDFDVLAFRKGSNGTACVLKTLCEVGQKSSETDPGSFLGEIIRAIFSLPMAQLKPSFKEKHRQYDDAHLLVENCAEKFPACKQSVWSVGFLLDTLELK